MRIGIDIDGVLTDIETFLLDYGSKYCVENNIPLNIAEEIDYDESKTFGWTDEQAIEFWNEYIIHYFTEYKPREFAKEVITKLKEEGNEIYIITARNEYGVPREYTNDVKKLTEEWLKKNEIPYDKIIFSSGSKLPYTRGNYIEVVIEDNPENIKDIAQTTPVICYNNFYNKDVDGKNITRAYSWYDVYNILKQGLIR